MCIISTSFCSRAFTKLVSLIQTDIVLTELSNRVRDIPKYVNPSKIGSRKFLRVYYLLSFYIICKEAVYFPTKYSSMQSMNRVRKLRVYFPNYAKYIRERSELPVGLHLDFPSSDPPRYQASASSK